MNISGVILAGGVNDRFSGKSKTDIMVDGKTIISRVIETINDIFVEIIIVANTPLKFNGFRNY
jgi:molybdopterin-guanine dinucleotide biosynthesis protein A